LAAVLNDLGINRLNVDLAIERWQRHFRPTDHPRWTSRESAHRQARSDPPVHPEPGAKIDAGIPRVAQSRWSLIWTQCVRDRPPSIHTRKMKSGDGTAISCQKLWHPRNRGPMIPEEDKPGREKPFADGATLTQKWFEQRNVATARSTRQSWQSSAGNTTQSIARSVVPAHDHITEKTRQAPSGRSRLSFACLCAAARLRKSTNIARSPGGKTLYALRNSPLRTNRSRLHLRIET
jgi:hypothetical protein